MEKCLIFQYLLENSVNAITKANYIGQRFDMYIRTSGLNRADNHEITDLTDIFSFVDLFLEDVDGRYRHKSLYYFYWVTFALNESNSDSSTRREITC